MATTFLNDTLTDVNGTTLASHTGELGATWVLHPSYAKTMEIFSNRAFATDTSGYYASGVPASADYCVSCVVYCQSVLSVNAGVTARMDTTANTFYTLRYRDGVDVQLSKVIAGTFTALGTYSLALSAGQSVALKLSVNGTSIKGYVDGIERISATDSSITAAGRAGFRFAGVSSTTTGFHVDSVAAHNIESVTLTGTANGQATATGALSLTKRLSGTVTGQAIASGTLSLTKRLSGTASGSVSASASLALAKNLAGTVNGVATATGQLAIGKTLSGIASGSSIASASLALVKNLTGMAAGAATATGTLTVSGAATASTILSSAGPGAALMPESLIAVLLGTAETISTTPEPTLGAGSALVSNTTQRPALGGGITITQAALEVIGGAQVE